MQAHHPHPIPTFTHPFLIQYVTLIIFCATSEKDPEKDSEKISKSNLAGTCMIVY